LILGVAVGRDPEISFTELAVEIVSCATCVIGIDFEILGHVPPYQLRVDYSSLGQSSSADWAVGLRTYSLCIDIASNTHLSC
jgi:hypothetical protein